MPHDFLAPVTRNVDLGHDHWLIEFESGDRFVSMCAGEFFMIGVPGSEALLRRPFSVCGIDGTFEDAEPGRTQVLYKVFGKGTALIASLRPGSPLSVLGPLGHGFGDPPDGRRPVFVAGGIGSAPFPLLARQLAGRAPAPTMFYGARTASDLPLLDWFREACDRVEVSTDDGSAGVHGRVTEPLDRWLAETGEPEPMLYACGPDPMLRATAALAKRHDVPCELALEAHMACGFGVCIGCVVPTKTATPGQFEYTRLCIDGPVLPAERMAWDLG